MSICKLASVAQLDTSLHIQCIFPSSLFIHYMSSSIFNSKKKYIDESKVQEQVFILSQSNFQYSQQISSSLEIHFISFKLLDVIYVYYLWQYEYVFHLSMLTRIVMIQKTHLVLAIAQYGVAVQRTNSLVSYGVRIIKRIPLRVLTEWEMA